MVVVNRKLELFSWLLIVIQIGFLIQIQKQILKNFLLFVVLQVEANNNNNNAHLTALFPVQPGKPVSWKDHKQIIFTLFQADNHGRTPRHSTFTGQMHWLPPNQQCQSTEGEKHLHLFLVTYLCQWIICLFVCCLLDHKPKSHDSRAWTSDLRVVVFSVVVVATEVAVAEAGPQELRVACFVDLLPTVLEAHHWDLATAETWGHLEQIGVQGCRDLAVDLAVKEDLAALEVEELVVHLEIPAGQETFDLEMPVECLAQRSLLIITLILDVYLVVLDVVEASLIITVRTNLGSSVSEPLLYHSRMTTFLLKTLCVYSNSVTYIGVSFANCMPIPCCCHSRSETPTRFIMTFFSSLDRF